MTEQEMFEKAVEFSLRFQKATRDNTDTSFGAMRLFAERLMEEIDSYGPELKKFIETDTSWYDEVRRRSEQNGQ